MAFVVDGSEWDFTNLSVQQVTAMIESLLARVDIIKNRNEQLWIGDDLQHKLLDGVNGFWAYMHSNIDVEVLQEVTAWLSSTQYYADESEWPDHFDDGLAHPYHDNTDVAWAHYNVLSGNPVACLSLSKADCINTESKHGNCNIHWVSNEATHREFWRSAILENRDTHDALVKYACHAYPSLYFYNTVLSDVNDLIGGYNVHRDVVKRYLSVLDDYGHAIFMTPVGFDFIENKHAEGLSGSAPNQVIEERFAQLHLEFAPENPNVRMDTKCRKAREITINSVVFYCEWHGKLQRHQNRLHIHKPVPESNNKIIVAIFHPHLPLP